MYVLEAVRQTRYAPTYIFQDLPGRMSCKVLVHEQNVLPAIYQIADKFAPSQRRAASGRVYGRSERASQPVPFVSTRRSRVKGTWSRARPSLDFAFKESSSRAKQTANEASNRRSFRTLRDRSPREQKYLAEFLPAGYVGHVRMLLALHRGSCCMELA